MKAEMLPLLSSPAQVTCQVLALMGVDWSWQVGCVRFSYLPFDSEVPRRFHRAALVNVDAIDSYGGEEGVLVLRLKDGTRVEASERRAAEVRRKLR